MIGGAARGNNLTTLRAESNRIARASHSIFVGRFIRFFGQRADSVWAAVSSRSQHIDGARRNWRHQLRPGRLAMRRRQLDAADAADDDDDDDDDDEIRIKRRHIFPLPGLGSQLAARR